MSNTLRLWDRRWRASFQHEPLSQAARWRAWVDMMILDHGFLRVFFRNLATVAPGVWRSNQPSPRNIAAYARRGFRTIINVRDASDWGSYLLEKEAARQHGIELVNLRLFSRAPPKVETILQLSDLFKRVEKPVLIHCKSGADRAGMAAALYLILAEDVPVEIARRQLSLRYLHMPFGKTGILDHFFDAYLDHAPMPFLDWVQTVYDRDALQAGYRSTGLGSFVTDRVLRRE